MSKGQVTLLCLEPASRKVGHSPFTGISCTKSHPLNGTTRKTIELVTKCIMTYIIILMSNIACGGKNKEWLSTIYTSDRHGGMTLINEQETGAYSLHVFRTRVLIFEFSCLTPIELPSFLQEWRFKHVFIELQWPFLLVLLYIHK